MFIREARKVDPITGKKYLSYQLVESYRTPLGPRQRILLTIGADVSLTPHQRKELANRIEEILSGAINFIPCSDHVEGLAQHFTKLLLQKQQKPQKSFEEDEKDFHTVDINSIRHQFPRTIGAEHIAFSIYSELDFPKLFIQLGLTKQQQQAAAATIISRAIFPESERATYNWLKTQSGLDEIMGCSFGKLTLDQLYSISDKLFQNKKSIESHLAKKEKSLFNLNEKIILYDITNTYFEGTCSLHTKAKRGKSKEKRSDCPLVALGVVLDDDGFPKHSEIFEGNINERATLHEMILRLNKTCYTNKPILVMDSGIATKDNVTWLKSQGYSYIVMMKKKLRPDPEEAQQIVISDDRGHHVSATLKKDEETGDNLLYCYSQQRQQKEQDIKHTQVKAFETALTELKNGLHSKSKMKTFEKVQQKIGRLREKYPRVAQYYEITVKPSKDNLLAEDITWSFQQDRLERSFNGTYSLRTNLSDLSPEKIWEVYMMLSEAESCFRCLKSEAGLRPNYHRREDRIDSHIFISLLAYHLIAALRMKLRMAGINYSWAFIRQQMQSHIIISTYLKTEKNCIVHIRSSSEPEPFHSKVYQALGLKKTPIKFQKKLMKGKEVVSKV